MEGVRIARAKRARDKSNPKAVAMYDKDMFEQTLIAIFPSSQYLADGPCQKLMLELARDWKGSTPAIEDRIAPFHPLSKEGVLAARDLDVYFVKSIAGSLNRVHMVIKSKVVSSNPSPDDSICESCHTRGWLSMEYRTSKVDGANAAVWLCPSCLKVDIGAQLKSLEDLESQRPKTNLPTLDDNPKLMDLMFDALQPAIREVRQTGSMAPFVILETLASRRMEQSFKTARLEMGYEEARRAIIAAPPEAVRYALVWLGYITREGVRYEGILVSGGERGDQQGAVIGVRYKQHLPELKYEPIGGPMILGPRENLLTLAGDPDAASKLTSTFTRLVVDMAHNHGPGHDENLTYEIKKCSAVYLDLRDLDRPFRKELGKEPDTVHVVVGRQSWFTFFKPEDKEVVLARDTLIPIGDAGLFPAFNDDGLITIGYSPPKFGLKNEGPKQLDLIVHWMTMFKVTDKDVAGTGQAR
jgi:hypothetical protein